MSIYDTSFSLIYGIVVAFILGACMGSFLNCTAIRIGQGENFVKGRSHCMHCGHELHAKDLVPILSWVFLKGKCRYCHEKISARYPLVEIIFALVKVACLLKFDVTVLCLRNYIYLCVLYLLTLTDLDTMTIPDSCHVIAVIVWIASAPLLMDGHEVLTHVAAGIVFGGGVLLLSLLMDRILGKESLGGGDVKLLAVTGLYFGFVGTLFVLMLSCIIGLVFHVLYNRKAGDDDESEGGGEEDSEDGDEDRKAFPFGPWIAIASAVILFAGEPMINWYMGLMG